MKYIANKKLRNIVLMFDNYEPSDLNQYLTYRNFDKKYHDYMYTDGRCYYYYYLCLGLLDKL